MTTLTKVDFLHRRKVPFHFCKPLRAANRARSKTMTRRIIVDAPNAAIKLRLSQGERGGFLQTFLGDLEGLPESDPRGWKPVMGAQGCESVVTPKAQPGDLIYSHEPIKITYLHRPDKVMGLHYLDDGDHGEEMIHAIPDRVTPPNLGPWKGRTLPWEWAREFFLCTAVKVERLQDISEGDAEAEGVLPSVLDLTFKEAFSDLWDSLNAKRGYAWESNPWVFAYSYHPVTISNR